MSDYGKTETHAAKPKAAKAEQVPHPLEVSEAPIPGAKPDDPALNYAERTKEAEAAATPTMKPLSSEAKMALADEIAARYVPPAPPPTIFEQIEAMKEGKAAAPAPAKAH